MTLKISGLYGTSHLYWSDLISITHSVFILVIASIIVNPVQTKSAIDLDSAQMNQTFDAGASLWTRNAQFSLVALILLVPPPRPLLTTQQRRG